MDVTNDAERVLAFRRGILTRAANERAAEAARELREIEAALARIADGTYGVCEVCGGAIGRDRLRALPATRRCLGCSD